MSDIEFYLRLGICLVLAIGGMTALVNIGSKSDWDAKIAFRFMLPFFLLLVILLGTFLFRVENVNIWKDIIGYVSVLVITLYIISRFLDFRRGENNKEIAKEKLLRGDGNIRNKKKIKQ